VLVYQQQKPDNRRACGLIALVNWSTIRSERIVACRADKSGNDDDDEQQQQQRGGTSTRRGATTTTTTTTTTKSRRGGGLLILSSCETDICATINRLERGS
jgi:hypothetical protein